MTQPEDFDVDRNGQHPDVAESGHVEEWDDRSDGTAPADRPVATGDGDATDKVATAMMAALIALAGLDQELALPASLTLLAPTDEAFDELSAQEMASLTEDLDVLRAFVERHIIDARLLAAELQARTVVTARSGDALAVRGRGSMLIIGGTRVLTKDIAAGAAVIHTVDTVVLP